VLKHYPLRPRTLSSAPGTRGTSCLSFKGP
jgi:hypothetical protein